MGRTINVGTEAYGNGDFKPIPSGTKAVASVFAIEEVPVKTGDNAGQPQLDVTFKIQEGEFSGREIRYQKIPLYDGTTAWKLVTFAEAVGWKSDGGEVEIPDNIQSVLGKLLTIKIKEDAPNSQGKVFNSVSGYAPASVGAASAASSNVGAPSWANLNSGS